ncbi:hypothetical protein KKH56_07230 [bacterium]|nr:hypothetical protein [bacterium]
MEYDREDNLVRMTILDASKREE